MQRTILIVDDEPHIRDVVRFAAQSAGFRTAEAGDGEEALARFGRGDVDLVVLDIKMPGLQGTDVCRALRAGSDVPVVFLTSCDDEIDLVVGLELGADDYVTKPFSPRVLMSRIRAVLRRATPAEPAVDPAGSVDSADSDAAEVFVHGRLSLDVGRRLVTWDGAEVALTATGFGLVQALIRRPGRVYGHDELGARMYASERHVAAATVVSHVRAVRKAFAAVGAAPIETVRGVGYKLAECT